jgi:hypothetical protein
LLKGNCQRGIDRKSAPRTLYIDFRKAKQCKSGGKNFKRDYAKEKLRENMGQSESKERGFKE